MENLYSILQEAQAVVSGEFDFTQAMHAQQAGFNYNARPTGSFPSTLPSAPVKALPHKAAKTKKSRSWKKPAGKPKRPLSAYNLFFQHERKKIIASLPGDLNGIDDGLTEEQRRRKHRKTHGKIGFADLARSIADKWKNVDKTSRVVFEKRADIEKKRYMKELEAWKKTQKSDDKEKPKPVKRKPAPSTPVKNVPAPKLHPSIKMHQSLPQPESLTSMMTVAMNKHLSHLMSTNMAHLMPPRNMNQQNNAHFHNVLMRYCGDNLRTHPSIPTSMPQQKFMDQDNYNGMSLATVNVMSSMMVDRVPQDFHQSFVPEETFSKDTFFEEDRHMPEVIDVSGESDVGEASLEDELHLFMNEFEADL